MIEVNKKTPIIYSFDIEGFLLEDVQQSIDRTIVISKSGWGYSYLNLSVNGDFIVIARHVLTNVDFAGNRCEFHIFIDATKLHNGMNSGSIVFSDACNEYLIPFDILMEDEPERRTGNRKRRQALCNMVNDYVNMRIDKLSAAQWNNKFQKELEVLLEIDEDNILYNRNEEHSK